MLRDQMISFLQTAVVFLLLTNAISALVAVFAMRMVHVVVRPGDGTKNAVERRLDTMLQRPT